MDGLDARFREHTMKLFERHGMTNVLYVYPTDAEKGAGKTLIYFLAHSRVEAAKKSFDAFRADPEWIKVRDASETTGKILAVSPPASVFPTPVDLSLLKQDQKRTRCRSMSDGGSTAPNVAGATR